MYFEFLMNVFQSLYYLELHFHNCFSCILRYCTKNNYLKLFTVIKRHTRTIFFVELIYYLLCVPIAKYSCHLNYKHNSEVYPDTSSVRHYSCKNAIQRNNTPSMFPKFLQASHPPAAFHYNRYALIHNITFVLYI